MKSLRSWYLCGLLILVAFVVYAGTQKMSVQVKTGQLRASPSFLGQVVGSADYGVRVELLQKQGAWVQVRSENGSTGWIHQSALTEKKIVMQAGDRDVQTSASGDEIALAGKGFNSDVEAEYKAKNPDLDYTWVDWMEGITVTPEESQIFLTEGDVHPGQGGEK